MEPPALAECSEELEHRESGGFSTLTPDSATAALTGWRLLVRGGDGPTATVVD